MVKKLKPPAERTNACVHLLKQMTCGLVDTDILGTQFGCLKDSWHYLTEIRKSEGKAGRGGEWAKLV